MSEHALEFRTVLESQNIPGVEWQGWHEEELLNGFSIAFPVENAESTVGSRIDAVVPLFERAHRQAQANLLLRSQPHSIVAQFDFPEEVKIPCEQYLLYFVQFLRDVGIEASAEIQERAGSVLFSVTPKDSEEALENVKAALDIYLRLPSNPIPTSSGINDASIEVQRLVSNIYHLKGQLALAGAVIQQKDVLIQQQQSFIQQQLLSGHILIESMKENHKETDKEPVIGNIVSVKKFDWEFVELDLPTLLRRLKQFFSRKRLQ